MASQASPVQRQSAFQACSERMPRDAVLATESNYIHFLWHSFSFLGSKSALPDLLGAMLCSVSQRFILSSIAILERIFVLHHNTLQI